MCMEFLTTVTKMISMLYLSIIFVNVLIKLKFDQYNEWHGKKIFLDLIMK